MTEHIPVFIEGQDDLIDILATAMCSICYNTGSFIDFYVLDCGICPFNKKQLESLKAKFSNFSIEFIPIDLKRFDGMKGWPPPKYQFLDCYARLLIPELKPEIDRAIYLDSDVIALDDIKKLWDQDLDGFETGMVADIGYSQTNFDNCTKNLGVSPEHIWANAGMILLDCKKWRENNISEKLLKIGREKKEHLLTLNEDILSVYYNENRYKRLDNRFNLSDFKCRICDYSAPQITDEYLANEWKHVVIYHFCHGKPFRQMKNNYNGRPLRHFDSFWFFASITPFYAGMKIRFEENNEIAKHKDTVKEEFKLFNIIPLLTVRTRQGTKWYRLFGFLPVMKKKRK